jgi:hypothetical protein
MHILSGDWRCGELYLYDTNIVSSSLLPCNNHVSYACVLHEGSNYISSYYSLCAEEKTWQARFEPLLDLLQWLVYEGQDYVPNVVM